MQNNEDLNERFTILEERYKALEAETYLLAEQNEESTLLGAISEEVNALDDLDRIIDSVLERLSLLKNIPFCASGVLSSNGEFHILHYYASFTSEKPDSDVIIFPESYIRSASADTTFVSGSSCREFNLSAVFSTGLFVPSEIIIVPLRSRYGHGRMFFFADEDESGRLSRFSDLFLRLSDLIASKEEHLFLLKELQRLNSELEQTVDIRTVQLAKSEKLFRALFEQANDGIFFIDTKGTVVAVNESFARLHGYTAEEILQLGIGGLDINGTTPVAERIRRLMDGESLTFEVEHYHKDGYTIPLEVTANLISTDNEQLIIAIHRDITERKRSEEALRESEEIFRQLMEHSPIYVFFKDQNIRATRLSRNYETMLGRPIDELLGKSMDDLFPSDFAKSIVADDIRILNEGKRVDIEEELNGRYFLTTKFPIDVEGKPRYLAGFTIDITERKLAENKLKEIITKNPMSIQILDKDGFTLEVNNSFKLLFGSVPPPGYSIFNDVQFAQQGLNVIFDKLRTGEVVHFPDVCFNPHDSIPGLKDVAVWTRTIGFSLNDSNDKPEQFVLMHENITDRKRAEKELVESRVNLKAIIENTSDSIWAIDTAYDIIYINEVFEKAYFASYGIHLKPGMNMLNNVPEPIRPQWKLRYDRALRNERFNFEDRFDFENITLFIEVSMNPILIDGKVIGASFFSRDITERKRAEEALKFSESNLQSVINREESIWSLDKNYNLIICNEYFRSAYRAAYGIDITIGTNLIVILSPELKEYWKPKYDSALSGQRITFEFQETVQNSVNYFEVILNPIITDGLVTGVTALSVNITDRKNSEQALRNAQKLESIGTLAGGIAHDFNNLMNAVLGQSALALNKLPKESPAVSHITKAIKASERVADLTRQLLAYSGRGKFLVDEIDLNNLVKENIQILEVSIPKTTQLRYELGSPSPHIKGDVSQIQQVIMNLIINAGEAMVPNPGQITLRTNRIELKENNTDYSKYSVTPLAAGSYALLQVSDTGSGISQETLTRIFDPFFTTKFTGRGLGLAAVLGIIKGHKGGLRIKSEVGKGTMFEILLPLVVTSAKTNAAEKNESAVVNGKERTILVIDDESSVIELLEDLLSALHFKVIGASDPLKGIERYRQEQQNISMVILDYSMPVMDGKAAFEELLKINNNVKVLLCSGFNEEETMSTFGTNRPTGFFQKPYKIEALIKRISVILSD